LHALGIATSTQASMKRPSWSLSRRYSAVAAATSSPSVSPWSSQSRRPSSIQLRTPLASARSLGEMRVALRFGDLHRPGHQHDAPPDALIGAGDARPVVA
jgi:hypothetical protein